jgi:hypothetical protein
MRVSSPAGKNVSVFYLDKAEFDALLAHRSRLPFSSSIATTRGLCTTDWVKWEHLEFPPRSVVVPKLSPDATKLERIQYGSILAHEIAHARGAGEWEARIVQRDYYRRNGLRGPSDKQIFLDVALRYGEAEVNIAEERAFGNRGSMLRSIWRALSVLWTEGVYRLQTDPLISTLQLPTPEKQ